jgi:hypothetical protein
LTHRGAMTGGRPSEASGRRLVLRRVPRTVVSPPSGPPARLSRALARNRQGEGPFSRQEPGVQRP